MTLSCQNKKTESIDNGMEARSDSNDVAHVAAAAESFEVAEPIDYSEGSIRFINGLEILSADMADQHYSQIIVLDSGAILVPTIGGFYYWENGISEIMMEPKTISVVSSCDDESRLRSMANIINAIYSNNYIENIENILTPDGIIDALNMHRFDRSTLIPIITEKYRAEGVYVLTYQLLTEYLNLNDIQPELQEIQFYFDDSMSSTQYGYFSVSRTRSDFYLYNGAISDIDFNDYRNEKRSDSLILPFDFHLDGTMNLKPYLGYSVTRTRRILNFSYNWEVGDGLIHLELYEINDAKGLDRTWSWTSPPGRYDGRIAIPRIISLDQGLYQYYHGDPFHPVIELDNGNFLTCFSDSPSRQWVEYNGEEFIDVNGPTVINSELPLSFDYSADKKYLFLFRNEDNALWRYEVVH